MEQRLPSQSFSRPPVDPRITAGDALFGWRGDGIVLIGEQDNACWVLARGWRTGDRLTDVRRWCFDDTARFVAQVRRLVADATGDVTRAVTAAAAAADWVQLRTAALVDER